MIDLNKIKSKTVATEYIGARVPIEMKERFKEFCKANKVSANAVIAELLVNYLDTIGKADSGERC